MNKMNWKWTLVFAALVGATVLLDAQPWAGKPGGDTPPPTPPPIKYKKVFLTSADPVWLNDINNSGAIVGYFALPTRRACWAIVDATTGNATFRDLNLLGAPWIDLQTNTSATGWQATRALSINDDGWIAGRAQHANGVWRAFLYAPDAQGQWKFYLLPQANLASGMYASDVNNFGEVVGRCGVGVTRGEGVPAIYTWNAIDGPRDLGFFGIDAAVNDTGIVIFSTGISAGDRCLLRYDLTSDTLNTMIGIASWRHCLSCFGTIAGERTAGRKTADVEIIRFSQTSLVDVKDIEGGSATKWALAINNVSDVLYAKNYSQLWLYKDGLASPFDVGALIGLPLTDYLSRGQDILMSDVNPTTDPLGTGFGLIVLGGFNDLAQPLVLIPQKL